MSHFTNFRYFDPKRHVWLPVYRRVDRVGGRYRPGFQVAGRPELSFTPDQFAGLMVSGQAERIPSISHITYLMEAA